jgi:hypothetical protein
VNVNVHVFVHGEPAEAAAWRGAIGPSVSGSNDPFDPELNESFNRPRAAFPTQPGRIA